MELRKAYIDCEEQKYARRISKEQQRRDSGEIDDAEYESRYEAIMDDRRIKIMHLIDTKYG